MSKIGKFEQSEILRIAKTFVRGAKFAPEEDYHHGETGVDFQDSCGCYSEWTTESCSLNVFLKGKLTGEGYDQAREIEHALRKWAGAYLEWNGCSCCENELYVNVRLYPEKKK